MRCISGRFRRHAFEERNLTASPCCRTPSCWWHTYEMLKVKRITWEWADEAGLMLVRGWLDVLFWLEYELCNYTCKTPKWIYEELWSASPFSLSRGNKQGPFLALWVVYARLPIVQANTVDKFHYFLGSYTQWITWWWCCNWYWFRLFDGIQSIPERTSSTLSWSGLEYVMKAGFVSADGETHFM